MIILGIDPGSSTIGYGLVLHHRGQLRCLDYGVFKINQAEEGKGLLILERQLNKLLRKTSPDLVAVEKLFFYKNVKTAMKVAQARGVILFTIAKRKIPIVEIAPLEVKRALTNYGRASKGNIQKMLKLILNLKEEPKPDDAADALALAIVGG